MHGHGFPPGFIRALVLVQYLIFLSDPALAIRQQYLSVAVPVSKYAGKKRIIRYLWFGREETPLREHAQRAHNLRNLRI